VITVGIEEIFMPKCDSCGVDTDNTADKNACIILCDGCEKGDVMQTLKLDDQLMKWVWDGVKSGTSRLGVRDISLNELLLTATNGTVDDIVVDVKSVTYTRLRDISMSIIESEGYKSLDELKTSLLRFYPDINDDNVFTLIEWD
jgi:hypothetical protein